MQIPYRKPGKYSQIKSDPFLTEEKFSELKNTLEKLKKHTRPIAASEVKRLAEMGDFSENTEYQMAKGRLRGINNRILVLEHQINHANLIHAPEQTTTIAVGHTVTIETNGKQKTYQILGSTESNPEQGIISHVSPLGAALIGRKAGEVVKVKGAGREVEYLVVKIQ